MENKQIKCTVHNCKHCNPNSNYCTLPKIKICDCNEKHEKEGTMCDSYNKKN